MNERRGELRLSIAKGHWALGEHDEALSALERAVEEDPCDSLREFAGDLDADSLRGPLAERLAAIRDALARAAAPADDAELAVPRLSTPTLAELLADQGHAGKALRVAEEVLRRRPDDERALAVRERLRAPRSDRERWIAELERWLRSAQQRRMQREAHG
jgi:tetratricopeptide (TPR) repeat protein